MTPQSNLRPSVKGCTRAESTIHTTATAPPSSLLDSLVLPTFKELKEAHYRTAAETREGRERAGRDFGVGQPGIPEYLPYAPPTPLVLLYENAQIISTFAKQLYAATETKYGMIPGLRIEDFQATETRAKSLLATRPILRRVEKLGAVQFALALIPTHGIRPNIFPIGPV